MVLLATEMDAVKSENPNECVLEGEILHNKAKYKGMLTFSNFFFFNCSLTSTNMDNCLWATSGPSCPYLASPGEEYFHSDLRETAVLELPVGCINTQVGCS